MNVTDTIDQSFRSQILLDSRQLATFHAVATQLSFTRAAAALGYVQSSVTAHIQALERDLGVALFERLGRTITLTDAGRRLLDYANRILALTEEARCVVADDPHLGGTLTIGAPDTLCAYRLPAVLHAFRAENPTVRVVFQAARSCADARAAVLHGQVDAALLLDQRHDDRRMITEILAPEPLSILVAPDHPLARRPSVHPADLNNLPTVLTERGCGYRDQFENLLTEAGINPGPTMEFASIEAIKECVKAGMGLTVLPRIAAATDISRKELIELPWATGELSISTQLVRHKDKWLSPTLAALLDCVRRHLAATVTERPRRPA